MGRCRFEFAGLLSHAPSLLLLIQFWGLNFEAEKLNSEISRAIRIVQSLIDGSQVRQHRSFILLKFEGIVLNFVNEQNRPLNSQTVADFLQKFNLKKTAIQKALDTLADGGRISFKEYGKQKMYLSLQAQFDIPNNEELNRMKEENTQLQAKLDEQRKAISEVEGEIKSLQSNLTLEEIHAKELKLRKEVKDMEEKLTKLRGGVTLVSPEERKAIEAIYSDTISQWRKRKRMFKDIWDSITENSPKDLKEFKEELGIEYDEDVGVSLLSFPDLLQQGKKRARGQ